MGRPNVSDDVREASKPVKLRMETIGEVLGKMREAKFQQELESGQPGAGRGVWLSMPLWRKATRQLEQQMAEVLEWERLLLQSREEVAGAQVGVQDLERALAAAEAAARKKVAGLEATIRQLQEHAAARERVWEDHARSLGSQAEGLLGALKEREGLVSSNRDLGQQLAEATKGAVALEARARAAEKEAADARKQLKYFKGRGADGISERDSLRTKVRDLELAFTQARTALDTYRTQAAVHRTPDAVLTEECRRLAADNARLVALLGQTKEWGKMGRQLGADGSEGGAGVVHYLPVEEAVMEEGCVRGLYPPLRDRPVALKASGIDPEEWAWVPAQAIDAALEFASRHTPAAPLKPLMGLVLGLNRIWRTREEHRVSDLATRHAAELRELHALYRQRAPYEAVVGKTRLADLKRQLRLQAAHARELAAKAAGDARTAADDSQVVLALGLDTVHSLSKQLGKMSTRNKKLRTALSAKSRKPPVCPSCLDSLLLQPYPQPDTDPQPLNPARLLPAPYQPTLDERLAALLAPAAPPGESHGIVGSIGGASGYGVPGFNIRESGSAPSGAAARPSTAVATVYSTAQVDCGHAGNAGVAGTGVPAASGTYKPGTAPAWSQGTGHASHHSTGSTVPVMGGVSADHGYRSSTGAAGGMGPGVSSSGAVHGLRTAPGSTAAAPAGASDVDGGRAARLAELIREYEQPVLRFSVWDKDGRVQASGAPLRSVVRAQVPQRLR